MDSNEIKITCPECGYEIDVDGILAHRIEERIKKDYSNKFAEKLKENEEQKLKLEQEKNELNKREIELQKTIEDAVSQKLKSQEPILKESLKKDIEQEQSQQFQSLQNELNEKSEQLKDYHKSKAEVAKLQREKDELKDKVEAEAELKLNNMLASEKEKIQKFESERNLLKISEKEKIIDQLKTQLSEAQRKAEQGSQQLQGEVQELAIEDFLKKAFPLDTIEEVKKGKKGADCLQTVNTEYNQNCGSIYYESKRAKNFQNSWIDKLKEDMRAKKASVGVLVTETMPSGMDIMGQIDGIWICTLNEFKSLSHVLRESIVRISDALVSQDNRGDKMSMMYDYLTSDEFKNHIKDIAEAFLDMQEDLDSEKRAMEGLWRKREKQNEKVLNNLNFMFNSIKGIAGNSIGSINALELPTEDDMENENEDSEKEQRRLL
jgi:hypothetical protein